MGNDHLANKQILGSYNHPDVLNVMIEGGLRIFSDDESKKATFFLQAGALLISWIYDLAILDFSGIRGQDLSRKPKQRNGFTLLELIMALGILSIGFLSLSSLSISTMKAGKYSQNRTAALQLPQEKLETIKTLPFKDLSGETETGLKTGNLGTIFQRETIVQRGVDSSLADIKVRVLWPMAANPIRFHSLELNTRIAG
jgi:prepilin-type N-terminal cleavage/methylation domain-containing protein